MVKCSLDLSIVNTSYFITWGIGKDWDSECFDNAVSAVNFYTDKIIDAKPNLRAFVAFFVSLDLFSPIVSEISVEELE